LANQIGITGTADTLPIPLTFDSRLAEKGLAKPVFTTMIGLTVAIELALRLGHTYLVVTHGFGRAIAVLPASCYFLALVLEANILNWTIGVPAAVHLW